MCIGIFLCMPVQNPDLGEMPGWVGILLFPGNLTRLILRISAICGLALLLVLS